jgi:hypothetical protein
MMANAYAAAVMNMLPQTGVTKLTDPQARPHESINDVHVHSSTQQQIFLPVSESRHFTREDAAKAFNDGLLPSDQRIAHPELIGYERSMIEGAGQRQAFDSYQQLVKGQETAAAERDALRRRIEDKSTKKVSTGRFEFRFKQIRVDDVGRNGRGREGTGWRYGVPFTDRRRGTVRIPTSVR